QSLLLPPELATLPELTAASTSRDCPSLQSLPLPLDLAITSRPCCYLQTSLPPPGLATCRHLEVSTITVVLMSQRLVDLPRAFANIEGLTRELAKRINLERVLQVVTNHTKENLQYRFPDEAVAIAQRMGSKLRYRALR